jgi:hypothetical protein
VLYLLIALACCLLVPWVPVFIFRRLPRRPPPPVSERALHELAAQIESERLVDEVEVVTSEDDPPRPDITRPDPRKPKAARPKISEARGAARPQPARDGLPNAAAANTSAPRLVYPWYYQVLNICGVFVMIGMFLALAFGWAALFHWLGEAHARTFPPGVFLFKPFNYGIIFALPGLFLGIFTSVPLLMLLGRLNLGRRRFLEYLFWDEGRVGQGKPEQLIKMLTYLALLISLLSAVFVFLAMNWYARLDQDDIAIKRLFGWREEIHSYSSVEQIVVTSHRKQGEQIVRGTDLGIRFTDGRKWNTDQTFVLPSDEVEQKRLLDFLQQKTGKPLLRARLLSDVPGW